jgi:hypothetical protein
LLSVTLVGMTGSVIALLVSYVTSSAPS